MIERRIIIGLITSTEFIQQIRNVWDVKLLESQMAKRIAGWCVEYYDKYNKAPGRDIESIYFQKLKEGLPQDIAEEIEEDILPELSQEHEREKFNLDYLLDQTHAYFKEKHLKHHSNEIQALVSGGELLEAEKIACEYLPLVTDSSVDLDLSSDAVLQRVEKAFNEIKHPVVKYPRQLGDFWNDQMIRGGFVALMGSGKRGKSFWLLDIAMRACKQGAKVAFFQAGDITENEQLKRIAVYLTKRSNLKKDSGKMFQPIRDCVWNQLDTCNLEERECDFGIFKNRAKEELRREITIEELKKQYKENPDYVPCHSCEQYRLKQLGTVWIEEVDTGAPLSVNEAKEAMSSFFIENKRYFKLSTHVNGTLSIKKIRGLLNIWKFDPDLIVIDYLDLLMLEERMELRHQLNEIWKGARALSQEGHRLVVTVTQADTRSYDQNRLRITNFTDDRRKIDHVTAMFGLNQDPKDREKKLGLMIINKLAIREGYFISSNEVTVLQNLHRGRPFLTSFW